MGGAIKKMKKKNTYFSIIQIRVNDFLFFAKEFVLKNCIVHKKKKLRGKGK